MVRTPMPSVSIFDSSAYHSPRNEISTFVRVGLAFSAAPISRAHTGLRVLRGQSFLGSHSVESQSGLIWTNEGGILPSPFSETIGIAVEERNAAGSGRIATFLLVPVVLDLDRLLAQSFANLEEMP